MEAGLTGERIEDSDDSYTLALNVSWEIDLWQKLAEGTAAADKDIEEQRSLYHAAQDTLVAEIMTAWLNLIGQQRAIAIQQRRLDALGRNEDFIIQRYRNGLGTLEDLDSARTLTASARATLEQQQITFTHLQQSLRTLLGRTDANEFDIDTEYPPVGRPMAQMPAQILARRPDLQAAYRAIEAAELRTSVAYKALLPSFSLGAALLGSAESLGSSLMADPVWSLLAQLTAPLYKGGELRATAQIAELETAYAYQEYRNTLLTAVSEVRNSLDSEQSLLKQLEHIESALNSARNNFEQYQQGYRSGLVDILDLLSVQQQTFDLEDQFNTLSYQRLVNRIDLGLALGLGVDPKISGALKQ
jgi:outer membrane protein TolC